MTKETRAKKLLKDLFSKADIQINGNRPWDIKVHNDQFYSRVLSEGTLGAGESYMDGWWEVEDLEEFFYRLINLDTERIIQRNIHNLLIYLTTKIFNAQTRRGSKKVANVHYNLSNDFYMLFLG